MSDSTMTPPGDAGAATGAPAPATQPAAAPAPAPVRAAPIPPAPAASGAPPEFLSYVERLRAEHEKLAAELAKRDTAEAATKAKVAELNEAVALSQREREKLAADRRADAIKSATKLAALKAGAVNEAHVVKLVLDDLTMNEAGHVVSAADPTKGVEAYVAQYLTDNPHLARPRTSQGSGASPFPAPAPGAPPVYDLRTADGATAYARGLTYAGASRQNNPANPTTPGNATGGQGR